MFDQMYNLHFERTFGVLKYDFLIIYNIKYILLVLFILILLRIKQLNFYEVLEILPFFSLNTDDIDAASLRLILIK